MSLAATPFIDRDAPEVRAFVETHAGGIEDPAQRAIRLFYAVRDGIRYDPYSLTFDPADYRASAVITRGRGWCVQKATVLAAAARAAGIPSRLAFADVRNHLATPRLLSLMRTDVFVFHGLTELELGGRWVKATPTFDLALCERFGVRPLDFDGVNDAVLLPYDVAGRRHMEYLRDRGHRDDLPLAELEAAFREAYPHLLEAGVVPGGDFAAEAAALRRGDAGLPPEEGDD